MTIAVIDNGHGQSSDDVEHGEDTTSVNGDVACLNQCLAQLRGSFGGRGSNSCREGCDLHQEEGSQREEDSSAPGGTSVGTSQKAVFQDVHLHARLKNVGDDLGIPDHVIVDCITVNGMRLPCIHGKQPEWETVILA